MSLLVPLHGDTNARSINARPPLTVANTRKREANRTRAEWLASIQVGVLTVPDLINAALADDGASLRRIGLRQLLLAQSWGPTRVERTLTRLRTLTDPPAGHHGTKVEASKRRLTVAWLVDRRVRGSRLAAWADVMQERTPPWTGFPFTPDPRQDGPPLPSGGGTRHG